MNANLQAHVFLSYTRRDAEIMHRVRDTLRDEGLNVWVDEGIEPGTPLWDRAVEDGLKTAACMLVILTPNVMDSKGVRDEIHFAGMHRVQIFTVLAQGEPSTAIPYTLSGNQWVDIRTNYSTNMARLMIAIQKYMGLEPEIEVSAQPDIPRLVQSEPEGKFTKSQLEPAVSKYSRNSIIRNALKYSLPLSLLVVGGFFLGFFSGSIAYFRYKSYLGYSDYIITLINASFFITIAVVVVICMIFPFIKDWLVNRKVGRLWIYGLVIIPAMVSGIRVAGANGLEGTVFTGIALVSAVFVLPALFSKLWPQLRNISRRLVRK